LAGGARREAGGVIAAGDLDGRAASGPSLPGLTRQSIVFAKSFLAKRMDARVKPGNDGQTL